MDFPATFSHDLAQRIRAKDSCLMLGLDPNPELMPDSFPPTAEGAEAFCREMIDTTADLICGVKIQLAYFEVFGGPGLSAVSRLLQHARTLGLMTMLDGKRGDIGATSAAYARAYFEPDAPLECDAITVNPLMGSDVITPFLPYCLTAGKALFVLVRTSNPSATEFQGYEDLSVRIGEHLEDWNIPTQCPQTGFSSLGAVIGATQPQMLTFFRDELPHSWLLAPGVGAQGGTLPDILAARRDGLGLLVPVSRAVLYASTGPDYATAARSAMQTLFDQQTTR